MIEPEHGFTLLHAAAYHGNAKAVQTLLKLGSDANQTDYRGQTALHIAIRFNYCHEIVERLSITTQLNSTDQSSLTPLLLASLCGRP